MDFTVTIQIAGEDVVCGRLYVSARRGIESASFRYTESYLANPRAFALAPDMPLITGTMHSQNAPLFRVFTDCMPDRWGRNLMGRAERLAARREARTSRTLLEADYLAGVDDRARQGAIRVWKDGVALASASSGVPREIAIPELLKSADLATRDMDADLRDLFAAGSSLGGARPKASVLDGQGNLSIAKFPKADESIEEDVCAWEHVALQLAERCGISVPRTRLLRISGRSVLILERFDRAGGQRIPYISGLTAIQGTDGERYSYLELVEFLEESGSSPQKDIRELWLRALFSCAIGNTDNHLRNYGFLRRDSGWALCPAFDINPTPGDGAKILATGVDLDTWYADPAAALDTCGYYRLSREEARQQAHMMAQKLQGWRNLARADGISSSSITAMTSCFETGIERLLAL